MGQRRTLYLLKHGYRILQQSGRLLISRRKDGPSEVETPFTIPARALSSLVLMGNGSISTGAIELLARHKVSIFFLGYSGRISSSIHHGTIPERWELQVRRAQDASFSDMLARVLCGDKISSQIRMIQLWSRRSGVSHQAALSALQGTRDKCRAARVPELMGLEGYAARTYFDILRAQVNSRLKAFHSTERSRRPPRDPFNCLLSYFYALLVSEVSSRLTGNGLHLSYGFLHREEQLSNRPNLALDFIEEFRAPIADRLALRMINRKEISALDFTLEKGGVWLSSNGKRKALDAFDRFMTKPRPVGRRNEAISAQRLIDQRINILIKTLTSGNASEFMRNSS